MTKPRVVSLFSGAGGMDLGFTQAGFEVIWANEWNKVACKTYRHNFGDHIICGDIREISSDDVPDCDVIIGGPPCQGFSVAGKMDPNDTRNQMVWEFCRIVLAKRPQFFVMENVAALGQNPKFNLLHDDLIRTFMEEGYTVTYKVLNSKDYETPQSRERFFIIGSLGVPVVFPEPILKTISVREAIADLQPPKQQTCVAKITICPNPVLRKSPYTGMLFNGARPLNLEKPSCTLVASMGGNRTPIVEQNLLNNPQAKSWVASIYNLIKTNRVIPTDVPSYIRRLTVAECARLQGFPDDFIFIGAFTKQYRQIGNSVPPPLAKHIGLSVMGSINGVVPEISETILGLF